MRECTADTRLQHASIAPEIEPTSHALKNGDNGGSRNANGTANNTISSAVDTTESSTESSTASNNISSNTSNRLDKSSSIDELTIETPHTNQNTESSNQHFRHHWHNLFMRGFPHHSTAQHASSLPETFHETSHNSALSLTATERELYYLKFVKPSDFTKNNSLYRDLVLTVLRFGASSHESLSENHHELYAQSTGNPIPKVFSPDDRAQLSAILSESERPEEIAFKLCVLLENSVNRYAHILSVLDESRTELQHMQDIKNKLIDYFSHSAAHNIAEGVTVDEGAKQLNNYLAYSIPSAVKKMMVILAAGATQSFTVSPDNINSVTIRHSHDPVWGSLSATSITLLSAVQIYLTKPNTSARDFINTLKNSMTQTYQALMSGTSSDDSLNRQTFSQRIKNSLSEINQERWLLHIGGWSQLLNGLDHFMQMGGQHIPRFALSTAFVYASAMSAAEVPHAWHAARDYRYARKAEKDLETFLDKWPLDPDHPKDILARSVRADMREDHHNDANAAFWTSFVNTAFATSMVSVLLGLVTAAAAPSHSIDSNNQHGLGHAQNQKDFSTFVPPVMCQFLAERYDGSRRRRYPAIYQS
ncbi:MAG: hypothetical protein P8077_08180 [Gammaproteobacteria bacterium]